MYRYCMLAIPSIALSSIVAVLGGILPSDMVEIGVHGVRTNPSPSAVTCAANPWHYTHPWQYRRSATP